MKSDTKNNFIFGLLSGAIATFVSWIIVSENSPLAEYFLWNPSVRNQWGILNFPIYLIIIFLNPTSYLEPIVTFLLMLIQWTIIGYFLKWFFGILMKIVKRTRSIN